MYVYNKLSSFYVPIIPLLILFFYSIARFRYLASNCSTTNLLPVIRE